MTFAPRHCDALCAAMMTQFLYVLSARSGLVFRQLREAVRAQVAQAGAATRAGCAHGSGPVWAMNVPGYRSSGVALCCAWIPQHRFAIRCQLLFVTCWSWPNRVHGLVQDEWKGATRLRFTLHGQSAPSCAHCCVRMRIRCTRLPIPVATRMCTRCANFQTTGVSWLQWRSWHCGDARVMDVLLGSMRSWRWSGETYIPVRTLVRRSLG